MIPKEFQRESGPWYHSPLLETSKLPIPSQTWYHQVIPNPQPLPPSETFLSPKTPQIPSKPGAPDIQRRAQVPLLDVRLLAGWGGPRVPRTARAHCAHLTGESELLPGRVQLFSLGGMLHTRWKCCSYIDYMIDQVPRFPNV